MAFRRTIRQGLNTLRTSRKKTLTDAQIDLISRGLKFIPVSKTINKSKIRLELQQDFEDYPKRMRLKYIFHGNKKEIHPFYVKSNWNPPVQPSISLESYLEEVKSHLAEIEITKPKCNLSRKDQALIELKQNTDINIKKADKGSITVVMNKTDKIREGQIDDEHNYRPLPEPMVKETHNKTLRLITDLHHEKHIDDMTRKSPSQTPNPPSIPDFYTLTKIHKPTI